MTDRAGALRSLRPSRTDGLPPPPPLQAGPDRLAVLSPPAEPPEPQTSEAESDRPQRRSATGAEQPEAMPVGVDMSAGGLFTLVALIQDPAATCRAIAGHREAMPARPLNVDLTPETASAFDDRCRALRLKKKDVVEVLLRGWLTAQGTSPPT